MDSLRAGCFGAAGGGWRLLLCFFLGVIYYEELFLKLYCFHGLSLAGAVFTLLFSIPIAMLLGALCGGVEDRLGRRLLVLCTALVSLWRVHRRCTITSF